MKQKLLAEFLGTMFLLMVVVGSGIMGERLAMGNDAIALLANSLATGAGLCVLIQCLGPLSGAHFNPAVSGVEYLWGRLERSALAGYVLAQILGAILGTWITHLMFNLDVLQVSPKDRGHPNLWFSEVVATFGLICTIALVGRKKVEAAPTTIALYVTGAYWFTSSTSFANPAVTIARSFTATFCGIAPAGVVPFIAAQVTGAALAYALLRKISPRD
ncbi:MAG: aquaporin [Bdellovibrionota bacterium]